MGRLPSQGRVSQPRSKVLFLWSPEATLAQMDDLPPSTEFSGQTHPDQPCGRSLKEQKNTMKPLIAYGLKPGRISYKTNRGYRWNVLVEDFTACGLGDMHGPRVNWIQNTERRACGAFPGLQTGGPQRSFIAVFFLEYHFLWKQSSKWWFGSPANPLFNPDRGGPPYYGSFSLFLWKNAALVVTWNSESGDLGIRLWTKLLPHGENSLPFILSDWSSEGFHPFSRSLGQWVSLPTGMGTRVGISQMVRLSLSSRPPCRGGAGPAAVVGGRWAGLQTLLCEIL